MSVYIGEDRKDYDAHADSESKTPSQYATNITQSLADSFRDGKVHPDIKLTAKKLKIKLANPDKKLTPQQAYAWSRVLMFQFPPSKKLLKRFSAEALLGWATGDILASNANIE